MTNYQFNGLIKNHIRRKQLIFSSLESLSFAVEVSLSCLRFAQIYIFVAISGYEYQEEMLYFSCWIRHSPG